MPSDHELIKRFPLNGTAGISTGDVSTPYHSRPAISRIDNQPGSFKFQFEEAANGRLIPAGSLASLQRPSLHASWDLVRQLGWNNLQFGPTPYRALNFQPQFAQYMERFKFGCLHPRAAGEQRRVS